MRQDLLGTCFLQQQQSLTREHALRGKHFGQIPCRVSFEFVDRDVGEDGNVAGRKAKSPLVCSSGLEQTFGVVVFAATIHQPEHVVARLTHRVGAAGDRIHTTDAGGFA